ncbi:MAG: esterase, partial [Gammaproteobacteria bacterium]|nr:esterase [Gammaproteobacteria bacterium]
MPKSLLDRVISGELWRAARDYMSVGRRNRRERIADPAALQGFLSTRASFIAQSSLYGYLKTRAGISFPKLFENDAFVVSTNIAKWNIWLACLADLAVWAGGLVAARTRAPQADIAPMMTTIVGAILDETGIPGEAGPEFPRLADQVRERLRGCDWASVQDNETPFSESPAALVRWAPVIEEFMRTDQEIVRNSVRFAWQDIRRALRRDLDADAVDGHD